MADETKGPEKQTGFVGNEFAVTPQPVEVPAETPVPPAEPPAEPPANQEPSTKN